MIDRNAHKDEEPDYLSYLLRLWCVEGDKGKVWRASLQSTQTRQQVGLASLEALFEYLRAETGAKAEQDFGSLGRLPKSMDRSEKAGADANGVDPDLPDP